MTPIPDAVLPRGDREDLPGRLDSEEERGARCDICACMACALITDCPVHRHETTRRKVNGGGEVVVQCNRCSAVCGSKSWERRPLIVEGTTSLKGDGFPEIPIRYRDDSEILVAALALCPYFEQDSPVFPEREEVPSLSGRNQGATTRTGSW